MNVVNRILAYLKSSPIEGIIMDENFEKKLPKFHVLARDGAKKGKKYRKKLVKIAKISDFY